MESNLLRRTEKIALTGRLPRNSGRCIGRRFRHFQNDPIRSNNGGFSSYEETVKVRHLPKPRTCNSQQLIDRNSSSLQQPSVSTTWR